MNTLHFICILAFTLVLPMTLFTSSVKMFFTDDQLDEMGVRIEPSDIDGEVTTA